MDEQQDSIHSIIRKMEDDYINGDVNSSKYVNFSMHDTIEKIYAYLNSTPTSGKYDSQGNEKPFFNIVIAAANAWYRATDIDRKNIKVRATKSEDWINSKVASVLIQAWMRKSDFGTVLNEWGRVLSRYGSSVLKFVKNDKGLFIQVIPWSRIICDAVDFDANPKIEILELTEAQLRERVKTHNYNEQAVKDLIGAQKARETTDKRRKDNKSEYYKLYEIHGVLSRYLLTDNEDHKDEFVQQMQVVSFVNNKQGRKDNYQDFTLVKGEEAKDPYMLTHLIKEDDRTLSIGAVEYLFQAQWMQNHSALSIKRQLELASKLIFQTADQRFIGRNALTDIENGDILVHTMNMPLTPLNNTSTDINAQQAFQQQWKSLGNEITGVSETMLGATPKSGTAWRQTEALLQESHSLFELMTENKGLDLERMFRMWIIPHIKKTELNNSDEIAATLEAHDIKQIDKKFIKAKANELHNDKMVEDFLNGGDFNSTPELQALGLQESLGEQGNTRFFKPSEITDKEWAEQFKDLEWELEIDITGEQRDIQEAMTTLNTALQVVMNPAYQQNEQAQMIVGRALELSGTMSPLEVANMPRQQVGGITPGVAPQLVAN